MFAALAFLPPEHTKSWFKMLQISLSEFEARDFVDYFEEIYLGCLNRNGSRRKPRFHLTMWNGYHRTIEHLTRTNNAIEGFHRGFESSLQMNKPDVWKILEAIHRQQALQEFTVAQQKGGSR